MFLSKERMQMWTCLCTQYKNDYINALVLTKPVSRCISMSVIDQCLSCVPLSQTEALHRNSCRWTFITRLQTQSVVNECNAHSPNKYWCCTVSTASILSTINLKPMFPVSDQHTPGSQSYNFNKWAGENTLLTCFLSSVVVIVLFVSQHVGIGPRIHS